MAGHGKQVGDAVGRIGILRPGVPQGVCTGPDPFFHACRFYVRSVAVSLTVATTGMVERDCAGKVAGRRRSGALFGAPFHPTGI